jgi:hypothetical protein
MKPIYSTFITAFILALSTLLPTRAFGQQNFQPGSITTLSGDTLGGFIDYRGWDRNPRVISFKPNLQAPTQSFRPLAIKGFRVNNEQYIGRQIMIDESSDNLGALTESATLILRPDTAFLQGLAIGTRSLYRHKKDEREYLYIEQQGAINLLVYKRFKPLVNSTVIQYNNAYHQQLADYLADCPAAARQAQTLYYAASSVQRLFKTYYACTTQQAFLQHRKLRTQAGVLLGATQTQLSFTGDAQRSPPELNGYTSYGPSGGVFFYVFFPGNREHFSLNNDLTYTAFQAAGSTTQTTSADISSTTNYSLALTYLKLNTLVRFTRPIGSGAVFVNAGISNGYAFQTKNEQVVASKFYSTSTTKAGEIFLLRRYEQGLVAGVGGSIKRLSVEARYERSNGFLDIVSLASSFERYSLLVGYRLH